MRECPNCGKAFAPNWNTRKYCCDACAKEHRSKRLRESRELAKGARA